MYAPVFLFILLELYSLAVRGSPYHVSRSDSKELHGPIPKEHHFHKTEIPTQNVDTSQARRLPTEPIFPPKIHPRTSPNAEFRFAPFNATLDDSDPTILEIGLALQPMVATGIDRPVQIKGLFRSVGVFFFGLTYLNQPFITAARFEPSIPTPENLRLGLEQARSTGTISRVEFACPSFSDMYDLYLAGVLKGAVGPDVAVVPQQYQSTGQRRQIWTFTAMPGREGIVRSRYVP